MGRNIPKFFYLHVLVNFQGKTATPGLMHSSIRCSIQYTMLRTVLQRQKNKTKATHTKCSELTWSSSTASSASNSSSEACAPSPCRHHWANPLPNSSKPPVFLALSTGDKPFVSVMCKTAALQQEDALLYTLKLQPKMQATGSYS